MYRLVGRLEASELSELYRAERTDDGAQVVLKLFHPKTTDIAYARAIADTTQQLAGVTAPGVARVLQLGTLRRRLAIVREDLGRYTLGQALTRLNTREVVLPPAVAIAFVIELADTLVATHDRAVVHGAITPGNVLIGHDGRALITDFGALTALMASPSLQRVFGRGRSSYRAPELLRANTAATVESDIYALGALAYELLTLKEASLGKDALATRQAEKLPPPSRMVRRLNARIDPIVMRALELTPARRFRTAAEFASALREFLVAQGGVPGRDDVRAFVEALFPKDVVVHALGPVPFAEPFELEDIAGVSDLVADVELAEVTDARAPFSGGAVTIEGMPAIEEPLETQEVPAVAPAWHAPAAAPVGVTSKPDEVPEISKRVRAIEDFEPRLPSDTVQVPAVKGPTPKVSTARQKLKTLVNFAVPFKRDTDPVPPDWNKEREDRRKAGVAAVRMGSAILTVFTISFVGIWLLKSSDPVGDLISWMPGPIEVELVRLRKPRGPVGAPVVALPNLKLPDFDKPVRTQPQVEESPRRVDVPKPTRPPTPIVANDCYAPPHDGPVAFLSVQLRRPARIELDGEHVCGVINKVPVVPGKHLVRAIDSKSKQEWKSTIRFEAGKHARLEPSFR